jgi:hypothetical protein
MAIQVNSPVPGMIIRETDKIVIAPAYRLLGRFTLFSSTGINSRDNASHDGRSSEFRLRGIPRVPVSVGRALSHVSPNNTRGNIQGVRQRVA